MNFCCLQLYCCDICYIWKLFIVRYRYGCIRCRELGMMIMEIGTLKCYLADEGDLLTLLEHPGHPADPSEDDPRHALPHGAQPLQVVQGDHQGHARVTCTGSLSNCPLVTSSVQCWGRGLGSNWCSERWLVAEYAGARQPGNLRPASQATRSRSAGIVSGGGGDTSIVWRLWSVSLFLIIPPNQSNPGQMWPPFRARSEGSRRFHTYREGRRPSPGWNTRHYQKALMLNRLLNMRSKCVIGIQT